MLMFFGQHGRTILQRLVAMVVSLGELTLATALSSDNVKMSNTLENDPDCLWALPLELRERVYRLCGLPVGREWYHACEDRVASQMNHF